MSTSKIWSFLALFMFIACSADEGSATINESETEAAGEAEPEVAEDDVAEGSDDALEEDDLLEEDAFDEDADEIAEGDGLRELRVDADDLSLDSETRARVADEERHLYHILVRYQGAERAGDIERSREEAERRAEEALVRVRAETFDAVVAEMSDDTANADHGGDMGMLGRGLLPEALDDALFAMAIGEIRGPIESPLGFHILRRGERSE